MKKNEENKIKNFNFDGWYGALIGLKDDFDHLEFYINNKKVRQTYLNSIKIFKMDLTGDKGSSSAPYLGTNSDKLPHLKIIDSSFKKYSNQILVALVSYIEQIIQEFFEIFYYYNPTRMKQVNGYVDLSQFLNCKSNTELLTKLSIAAATAVKGGITSKLQRIGKESGENIDRGLIKNIEVLIKKRNNIIHKSKVYSISSLVIEENVDNIIALLYEIERILILLKLPTAKSKEEFIIK